MGNDKLDPRKMSDKQLHDLIKSEAKKLDIAPYPIPDVLTKVRENYGDWEKYLDFRWKSQYNNYVQACISWALDEVKSEKPIENKLYYDLEKYANRSGASETEKKRVEDIVSMLSTEGIFPKDWTNFYTLNEVMQWLDPEERQALVDAILTLKDYCDAEGVRSVLESADVNGIKRSDRNLVQNPNNTEHFVASLKPMSDAFITRLGLMSRYVERVATKNYKGQRFCNEFWIRSTGSDPHCDGEHALFLVEKVSGDIAFVYRPHDLSSDNMIVGKTGILENINKDFTERRVLSETLIKDEVAFATINIDVENHIEEFVTKKSKMTSDEAKKYFFRAGLLKAITDAMAVIDLHGDNIMPTQNNAPLIIDAEVDFFRYVPSGLGFDALREDRYQNRFSNASFEVKGERDRSGGLFKNEKSVYHEAYKQGCDFMCKLMFDHKNYFADMYERHLQDVGRVRIVPIKTQDLNQKLFGYIISSNSDKQSSVLKMIADIKKILNGVADDGTSDFIFNKENKLKVKFYETILRVAIKQALDVATIIALYVDMSGEIYLNRTKIGDIVSIEDERTVNKKIIIDVMKKSFLKVVESYGKKLSAK